MVAESVGVYSCAHGWCTDKRKPRTKSWGRFQFKKLIGKLGSAKENTRNI